MKNMKTRRRVFLPCSSPIVVIVQKPCNTGACKQEYGYARQPLNSRCFPRRHDLHTSSCDQAPPWPPPAAARSHSDDLAFPFSKSYRSLSHPIAASPISDLRLRTCLVDCASSDSFKGSVCKAPTSKATCCLFCLATPSCRRWLALHRSASSLRTPPPSETSRRASPLPPA